MLVLTITAGSNQQPCSSMLLDPVSTGEQLVAGALPMKFSFPFQRLVHSIGRTPQ
jgi:hypothetical protein